MKVPYAYHSVLRMSLPSIRYPPPPSSVRPLHSSDIYRFTLVEDFGARYMLDSLGLPSRLSPAAVELVCDTLIVDRSLRPSLADELVRHAFFEQ